MKKIAVLLILALSFGIFAGGCASFSPTGDGSSAENSTGKIETDENLLTVDITLPASVFEGADMSNFDADAYAAEQGFKSAKVNRDGSVTISMTKSKHRAILKDFTETLDTTFEEFVGGQNTPYIKGIVHNDDFTKVTMKVEKDAYENSFDFTPLAIGMSVGMYHAFAGIEYRVEIFVEDAETGESINKIVYPDDFSS